jgi:hypothetical protein
MKPKQHPKKEEGLMNSMKPTSGHIGGCPGTGYIGTISHDNDACTSITSLRHCSTSLTLRASSTSITIPSSDGWGVIRYIGRACAINGVSLLTWYAPMTLTPWRLHSFRMVVAFRWS